MKYTKRSMWRLLFGLVVLIAFSRAVEAGPSYDIDQKVLGAGVIAEVEITVLPKTHGWQASADTAKSGKVLRVLYQDAGAQTSAKKLLRFPFSNLSRCWADLSTETRIRTLVFLPEESVHGLEEDDAAYTSLNTDYAQVVEAVATVSHWRLEKPRDGVDTRKLKVISETSNPFLRYVGARFLKNTSPSAAIPLADKILSHQPVSVTDPEAECAQRRRRGLTGR